MSLFTQLSTITAVILGALWFGIGVKGGQDIYDVLIRPRFKKWLRRFRKIKSNWRP